MTPREIKFRGISDEISNNGQWVYGGVHFDKESGFIFITLPENKVTETFNMIYPNTLGQFTGLKDSQGKEIYEGDIVDVEQDEYFKIQYWEDGACFIGSGVYTGKVRWVENRENFRGEHQIGLIESKVIGNVFENPDLLPQPK